METAARAETACKYHRVRTLGYIARDLVDSINDFTKKHLAFARLMYPILDPPIIERPEK